MENTKQKDSKLCLMLPVQQQGADSGRLWQCMWVRCWEAAHSSWRCIM